MSAIIISNLNGCKTASATYFQATPNTGVSLSSGNPWATTPTASFNLNSLMAKINTDGSIQATGNCRLKIRWGMVPSASSGTQNIQYWYIQPSTSSSTATPSQTTNVTYPLFSSATTNLTSTPPASPASTLVGDFIAKNGDVFVLAFAYSGSLMRNGILEIATEPLV